MKKTRESMVAGQEVDRPWQDMPRRSRTAAESEGPAADGKMRPTLMLLHSQI